MLRSAAPASLLVLALLLLTPGCDSAPNEQSDSASPSEPAPMPVAKAIDGTPEISIATLRKRLGANSQAEFQKAGGRIIAANLARSGVTDLEPLKGLPLKYLDLTLLSIDDLSPLAGMPLEELFLEGTQVTDLSPLKGMPLRVLRLEHTPVKDISPLAGMELNRLGLFDTQVEDISVVKDMPLETLWLTETPVKDISVLKGKVIVSLDIEKTSISDLSPLTGNQELKRLNIAHSEVTDLRPLGGLRLERLIFTPEKIQQGMDVARTMLSLREIGRSFETMMEPAQFWATEMSSSPPAPESTSTPVPEGTSAGE
ncbi:leucine-rich repeat domain-containing protein [Rubinisphaera margarita]|uniref:leucine-rich repeat domain-containing protein n=1 Tax=Rubinisphaera margarita TaxID=2909586 RepID=UPI001EE968E0|nr:hypothetical protein [Rubinisphaera margarita]MCG6157591.1 hypothetical protein [Rubinisphaera margarita]